MNYRKLLTMLVLAGCIAFMQVGCAQKESADSAETTVTETTPEQAPAPKSPFADLSLVFFPGGSEGGSFASVVYRGAKAAEELLGCKVTYFWSGWNNEKMISQFKDAVAMKPDGIAVMGHPGVAAFSPLVEDARSQGIVITSQNTTLPALEEKFTTDGFGYVGQELFASGEMLAKNAAQMAGLKKGNMAFVWGLKGQETRGLRTKGCIKALKKMGIRVKYLEITDEINADASLGTPVITSMLSANPKIKLVIADHGALTATMGTFLKAAGLKPGDVFAAGFDLSAATASAIEEGWVGAVLDQQPFLQGFLPVIQMALTKKFGFSGLHIDTGAAIIHKGNIALVKPLAEKGIR